MIVQKLLSVYLLFLLICYPMLKFFTEDGSKFLILLFLCFQLAKSASHMSIAIQTAIILPFLHLYPLLLLSFDYFPCPKDNWQDQIILDCFLWKNCGILFWERQLEVQFLDSESNSLMMPSLMNFSFEWTTRIEKLVGFKKKKKFILPIGASVRIRRPMWDGLMLEA